MHTNLSIPLASLFVFLAGFNVWIMLTGRGAGPRGRRIWTQIHRICGYLFIAIFAIFCFFMLTRIRGWSDELSSRIILHMALALLLAPLLFLKVIVVRCQKAAWGLLMAIGTIIFAFAFTLVAVNVSVHYLRDAEKHRIQSSMSEAVVIGALVLAALGFVTGSKRFKRKSGTATATFDAPSIPPPKTPTGVLNFTLARIETQSHDAKTLRFVLPRGQQIAARPGQFLTFEWQIDGQAVIRSYSICSSPAHGSFIEITPKRIPAGYVSHFLNDRATIGLTVKAKGPYGKFYFDETKHKRIVLIAGGSGCTPMISILRYIDDLCIPAEATLIYCVRNEEDELFKVEFASLRMKLNRFRYALVTSKPSSDWTGWKGHLRREILEREVEKPLESTYFLCGPSAFMELGRDLLKQLGVDPSRILEESFGGAVAQHTLSDVRTGSLEIKLSRSESAIRVSPEQTLLESLEKNGVLIPSGCRQGNCGTCRTKLLRGNVRMETEEALTNELRAERFILPCVSRPLSDVTLDA
jgi:ferredoxin-NADP reductase